MKRDRKSTRLNSSHLGISYAVFCLKKKKYYLSGAAGTGRPQRKDGERRDASRGTPFPPPTSTPLTAPLHPPPANCLTFFFLMIRRPPRSPLFPYTTLSRSGDFVLFFFNDTVALEIYLFGPMQDLPI